MVKFGLVQMLSGLDKQKNVEKAIQKIEECVKSGAEIVVLPEIFNGPYSTASFKDYAEEDKGQTWQKLSETAKKYKIYLVGGSIPEIDNEGKIYNTSYIFNREGNQIGKHRKMHLFDIDVEGGQRFKESDALTPGNSVTVFDTEFGKMGVCICFDLRFVELSRIMVLEGAKVIIVPAAFNMTTGPAHWELLFRQRAVDNQCFTVGVAPARDLNAGYISYGHSIVASPWGDLLYQAEFEETIKVIDIDLERVESVRKQLPLLSARRTDVYTIGLNH